MTCKTCKHWSAFDARPVEACGAVFGVFRCLSVGGPHCGSYTAATDACGHYEIGDIPVDMERVNAELTAICAADDSATDHEHAQEHAHGH